MQLFKINNATTIAANPKTAIVAQLLRKCGLTYSQWVNVLFETGCKFIEENVADYYMQKALLENKDLGFWDWWLLFSVEDDETLLDYIGLVSFRSYCHEKQRLIKLYEAHAQFTHFLNANQKLNGKQF